MRGSGKGKNWRRALAALAGAAALLAGGAGAGEAAAPAPVAAAPAGEAPVMDLVAAGAGNVFASGQPDAAIKAEGGPAPKVAFVCHQGKESPWPGIAVRPRADGKPGRWDLRPYAWVEALVENPNDETVNVALRVDDDAKLVLANAWQTVNAKLPPHKVTPVRAWLTDLSYGRRYILQKEAISQVLLFGGLPGRGTPLVLHRLSAGGRAGDVPPNYEPLTIVRGDGTLADFARPGRPAVEFAAVNAEAAVRDGALEIRLRPGAASGATLFQPGRAKWHLGFFNQVEFDLENPGERPLAVRCSVNNWRTLNNDACAKRDFTVPARGSLRAVVPFMADNIWRSNVGPDGKAVSDAASERQRGAGDSGGQALFSDEVPMVAVVAPAGGEGTLRVKRVAAAVAAPEELPEWTGKRPPVPGEWKQTLDESFDGEALNEKLWNPKMPWRGQIPMEIQRYNPKNVFVKDGMLHLRSAKERSFLNGDPSIKWVPEGHYTSAVVTSFAKWWQRYGYFEARLKPQKAFGLWPAFWCMPYHGPTDADRKKGTTGGAAEIDIFEHLTRFGPYRSNIAVHWNNYGPDHRKTGDSRIYYNVDKDGFVVAGLLWEPGRLTWYVNHQPVGVWESPAVPTVAVYLKFTIQMGNWAGFFVEDDKLGDADFLVDYVRAWQKPEWEEKRAGGAPQ